MNLWTRLKINLCIYLSFKEQQLKKIKAKQKRLKAILGGTEILNKVNEIELEEDEGMGGGWKSSST